MLVLQVGCVSGPINTEASPTAAIPRPEPRPEKIASSPIIKKNRVANLRPSNKPKTLEIKSLVGRDAKNIQKLFGIPNFVRTDFNTQFWRYEGKACILNIAMYPEGSDTDYRVFHSETNDEHGRAIDPQGCIKKLYKGPNF